MMQDVDQRRVAIEICVFVLHGYHTNRIIDLRGRQDVSVDLQKLLSWYDSLTPPLARSIFASDTLLYACMGYEDFWSTAVAFN
jgi:hypothetical protein